MTLLQEIVRGIFLALSITACLIFLAFLCHA